MEIQKNYPFDTERFKHEVLELWLRNTLEVSWKSLVQAVKALGRYMSLTQKLERKIALLPDG